MEKLVADQSEVLKESDISMEAFHAEIFSRREKERADEEGTSHLTRNKGKEQLISVDELTLADAFIFEKLTKYPRFGSVSDDEWKQYSSEVMSSGNAHREQFFGFLANVRSRIIMQEFRNGKK